MSELLGLVLAKAWESFECVVVCGPVNSVPCVGGPLMTVFKVVPVLWEVKALLEVVGEMSGEFGGGGCEGGCTVGKGK